MPLTLTIKALSGFDETTNTFFPTKDITIKLEHSLVSVSKWEEKWHIPFFSQHPNHAKNEEMIKDYIRCMNMTQNVDERIFKSLDRNSMKQINEYLEDSHTATTIGNTKKSLSSRPISSELIYYWMFSCSIPKECEKWNISRLLMLIRVFGEEQNPSMKMDGKTRAALNEARLAKRRKR